MEGKQIVKIFTLLIILVGLTTGVVLVDQRQDIREKAAACSISTFGKCGVEGGCNLGEKCMFIYTGGTTYTYKCKTSSSCPIPSCSSVGGVCTKYGCESADILLNGSCALMADTVCCGTCSSIGGSCLDQACPSGDIDKGRINCPVDSRCCAPSGSGTSNKCSTQSNPKCENKILGEKCDTGYTCQKGTVVEYGGDGLIACKCKAGGGGGGGGGGGSSPPTSGGSCGAKSDNKCKGQNPGTACGATGNKTCQQTGKDSTGALKCTCQLPASPSPSPSPSASPSPSPSPSPGAGNLTVLARLQGITETRPLQPFLITIKKAGLTIKQFVDTKASADAQGIFNLSLDSSGFCNSTDKFDLFIKSLGHLQKKFAGVDIPCSAVTINKSTSQNDELRAGDASGDNAITIEDISLVLKYYTTFSVAVDTAKADMISSDINMDGYITIDDVALVALNWSDFTVPGDE